MFAPVIENSILGRAIKNKLLDIKLTNIRDYTLDKHNRVDDTPFGGGAGMVMSAEPIFRSLEAIHAKENRIIYMSPKGKQLDQVLIEELSSEKEFILLCGHYEGIDQRIIDHWNIEEISVGDYILTGGEIPAMILIDAVARLIPKVLGNSESHYEESIYSGLLEYPHYTRPREYKGYSVPDVLTSGNHKLIHLWRFRQSLKITKQRRPDLFQAFLRKSNDLSKDEKKILEIVCKTEQY